MIAPPQVRVGIPEKILKILLQGNYEPERVVVCEQWILKQLLRLDASAAKTIGWKKAYLMRTDIPSHVVCSTVCVLHSLILTEV